MVEVAFGLYRKYIIKCAFLTHHSSNIGFITEVCSNFYPREFRAGDALAKRGRITIAHMEFYIYVLLSIYNQFSPFFPSLG